MFKLNNLKFIIFPKIIRNILNYITLGKIASEIIHDLINPLTSLIISVNEIKSKEVQEASQNLANFIRLMQQQINNKNTLEIFSLTNTIQDSILLIKYKAISNNIRIICAFEKDFEIFANKNILVRSILNLINNAIDSYENFPKDNQDVVVSVFEKNDNINISIKDFGCGISKKSQKKIFNYFYTNKKSGTGIGLSTTNKLIKKEFNGKIIFTSELNKGSNFTILIPIKNYHPIQHQ